MRAVSSAGRLSVSGLWRANSRPARTRSAPACAGGGTAQCSCFRRVPARTGMGLHLRGQLPSGQSGGSAPGRLRGPQLDLRALTLIDDRSISLVLIQHVIEEIEDYEAALREIKRILAPRGDVLLEIPFDASRARSERHEPDRFGNVWSFGRDLIPRIAAHLGEVELHDYAEGASRERSCDAARSAPTRWRSRTPSPATATGGGPTHRHERSKGTSPSGQSGPEIAWSCTSARPQHTGTASPCTASAGMGERRPYHRRAPGTDVRSPGPRPTGTTHHG